MTAHRFTALLLIAIAAFTMAYMSLRPLVPALATLVALAGAAGRLRLRLRRERELIAVLVLATIFAAIYRIAPYEDKRVHGPFLYPFCHALGLFALSAMALKMVVHFPALPLMSLPLYGLTAMICAGAAYVDQVGDRVYHGLSLALVCMMALYFRTGRQRPVGAAGAASSRRRTLLAAALLVAVTGGIVGSTLLVRYQQEMNRLLLSMSLTFRTSSIVGFSHDARLGSLHRLKASRAEDQTALRVFAEDEPGYLRGLVFERFSDSVWRLGGEKEARGPAGDLSSAPTDLPDGTNTFEVFPARGSSWRKYEIWPTIDLTSAMFTPPDTAYLSADTPRLVVDESETVDAVDIPAGSAYHAFVPRPAPVRPLSDGARGRYTALPALDERVRKLAEEIFRGGTTAAEKIRAVQAHFRERYRYGLGIRVPRDQDPLTHFLLERPAGHCEYFASGAAVLLRLGGVPARYVTGFVVQERNDLGGYWLARNKDAHAWVEAWDDSRGWVLVEATPPDGVPSPRRRGTMAYLWDCLKLRFQELRVMLATGGVAGLFRWLGDRLLGLGGWLIGTTVGRVVTALLAALALVIAWRKLQPTRRRPRPDRLLAAMHRLLGRIDRRLARRGLVRSAAETLHQFSRRVLAAAESSAGGDGLADAAGWYVRYARVRYSPGRSERAIADLARHMPSL